MGIADWEERALAGFRKSMELDSLYLPGYNHALPLAPSMGDMEMTNRVYQLRARADTGTYWRKLHAWYMAARSGDNAAGAKALESTGQLREALLQGTIRHMLFDGTGASFIPRALGEIIRTSPTEALRRGRSRYAHDVMMNLGRPSDARRYLEMSKDSANDINIRITLVRDAIVGEGDRASAMKAAEYLSRIESEPEAADSARRQIHRAVVRVMEPWRMMVGDTSRTRQSIARLRNIARYNPPQDSLSAQIEIAYLEVMLARIGRTSQLRALTERFDSLMGSLDFNSTHAGRNAQHSLALAHAWLQLGDPARALAAVGRHPSWNTEVMPYLGVQVREIGRIAAIAGNRKRAVRSYRQYLGMRAAGEPSTRAQVDSVRAELAALDR